MRIRDRLYESRHRQVETLVREGERLGRRPVLERYLARFAFAAGVVVVHEGVEELTHPIGVAVEWVTMATAVGIVLWWAGESSRAVKIYRAGWTDGRSELVATMHDYDTYEEWLQAAHVHDAIHVLGHSIEVPDLPPWANGNGE